MAEDTQLLEHVLKQSSKSFPTYETLKLLKKVHQVRRRARIKENGKDDTELRDFAIRFNRLDAAVQLLQGAGCQETAQFRASQRRAAVETKDEEAAKRGKPDVWNLTKRTSNQRRGRRLRCRAAEVVAGISSAKVVAGADQEMTQAA